MEKIRFAHLADTHLCREGKESFINIPVREHVEQVIDSFCSLYNPLDFVVVTGDFVDDGDPEDYRFMRQFVERMQRKLNAPIFLTIGNHDNRDNFFAGYLGEEAQSGYFYSQTINGLRLIALDSVTGGANGKIGAEQLAWLKEELKTPSERGTVLAFHHPIAIDEFLLGEHCLEDGDALCDVIRGRDVIGILSGHTHRSNQSVLADNILSVTADSMAYSLDVNGDEVRMIDRFGFNMLIVMDKTMYNNVVQMGSGRLIGRYSHSRIMKQLQEVMQDAPLTANAVKEFEKLVEIV